MTTYDVLVADELSPEFTNANPHMPEGFRIIGLVGEPTSYGCKRYRVKDDNAPAWTEGKLVAPTMTVEYETNDRGWPTGNVSHVVVTDWIEVTA